MHSKNHTRKLMSGIINRPTSKKRDTTYPKHSYPGHPLEHYRQHLQRLRLVRMMPQNWPFPCPMMPGYGTVHWGCRVYGVESFMIGLISYFLRMQGRWWRMRWEHNLIVPTTYTDCPWIAMSMISYPVHACHTYLLLFSYVFSLVASHSPHARPIIWHQ